MRSYTPGEVAEKTGFTLDTLRYYERIGLIGSVRRTAGGQRVFTDDDISWLGILRCLRETGMPIARMRRYAELGRGGDETIAERLALLEEHDRAVEQQITRLRAQQAHIKSKIEYYHTFATKETPSRRPNVPAPAARSRSSDTRNGVR